MATKIIKAQMMQRRDTAANWTANNPVLLDGELGIVTDQPNSYKVGDGSTAWNDLPLRGFDGNIVQGLGDSTTAVISQAGISGLIAAQDEKLAQLSDRVDNIEAGGSGSSSMGSEVEEAGFHVTDKYGNVAMRVDDNGLAAAKIAPSLVNLTRSDDYARVYSTKFSELGAEWVGSGWAASSNGATPSSTGSAIYLNKIYYSDNRYMEMLCTLGSNTILRIPVAYGGVNSGEGASCFVIDMASKTLKICSAGNGADAQYTSQGYNATTYIATASISNLSTAGKYIVRIHKKGIQSRMELIAYESGKSNVVEHNGWGCGRQNQHYYLVHESGTAPVIHQFKVFSLNKPDVVFTGDSITEGVYVYDRSLRYAELYRQENPHRKVVISARGGQNLAGILNLFDSEWNIVKPRILSVLIGANGGNSATLFASLKEKCDAIGCQLVVHYRTCQNGNAIADSNGTLIPALDVEGARFDIATATSNTPNSTYSNYNSLLYADSGLHPNMEGNKAMYARMKADCAFLFND